MYFSYRMKLSQIIRYPFYLLGFIPRPGGEEQESLPPDIAADTGFLEIYSKVKAFSMVDLDRCYALFKAVQYILNNNIPGDFVECGVWKGGSCMLIAYSLLQAGVTDRKIWLYDTFDGMTKPGVNDGLKEKKEWEHYKVNEERSNWFFVLQEEVEANMKKTAYPFWQLEFVKGRVEDTIPIRTPTEISLLRLDTDWYESTYHELFHLYPLYPKRVY